MFSLTKTSNFINLSFIVQHQGTESESFVKHARPVKAAVSSPTAKNSSWRSKHEDFIKTIRAAKKMQAHLDGGGKLSGLYKE